jgi:hypothetical protein
MNLARRCTLALGRWFRPKSTLFLCAMFIAPSTVAGPVVFDFDNVVLSVAAGNGLGLTGGNAAIQTYMNQVLTSAGFPAASVTVAGGLATKTYAGEGHIPNAGPGLPPKTLGTSNGGILHGLNNDGFIINNHFGIGAPSVDRFSLTFNNFTVYSLSFDWEIFPDATCALGSACASNPANANWPDIGLLVDGVEVWSAKATNTPGLDPQGLGVSPTILLKGGQVLTFRDWPAEIGIDSLRLNAVPEPPAPALIALSLGLMGLVFRRGGKVVPRNRTAG